MKSTGIIRRVDDLGRIVIPRELRRALDIREGDPMEFFSSTEGLILRVYVPGRSRIELEHWELETVKEALKASLPGLDASMSRRVNQLLEEKF